MFSARLTALVFGVVALLTSQAIAQTDLIPGYLDSPPRGPAAAKGAVIYSHGLPRVTDGIEDALGATPYVVDSLRDAGWDVFRQPRRWTSDALTAQPLALAAAASKLRDTGYTRIVLVGQSFGAWISLAAASKAGFPIHAVIAFAPAAFGTQAESPAWEQNAKALYPVVEAGGAERTLVFLFNDDPYDPGERGDHLRAIFERRGLAADVVDRPSGYNGHTVALTRGFSQRFGPCLADFIEAEPPEPYFVCDERPPLARQLVFDLPQDLRIQVSAHDTEPELARLIGRWYGVYPHGREVQLIIHETFSDQARAIYAFGPVARGGDEKSGFTRRRGTYHRGTGLLVFNETQTDNIIEATLLPDSRLLLTLRSRRSGDTLTVVLRRLD